MVQNAWPNEVFQGIARGTLWVSAAFTIVSGLDYMRRGVDLFRAR